jgi:hypothetical protein
VQSSGEIMPACAYHRVEKWRRGLHLGLVPFRFGGPSSSARSGGAISGMGCTVPLPFAAGGNQSYLEFWAIATCGTQGAGPQ